MAFVEVMRDGNNEVDFNEFRQYILSKWLTAPEAFAGIYSYPIVRMKHKVI